MLASEFKEVMTVRGVRWYGSEIFELSLEREGLPFTPGDCLALFAADGRVSRPYSIASGTDEEVIRFVIRQMPGGEVTPFLAARQPGEAVRVSPPFGWFRPGQHAAKRPCVMLATGTGIAPFLSALRSDPALEPAALLYGVRQVSDLIDAEWLVERTGARIAISRDKSDVYFHGRITALLEQTTLPADADYYLCGLDAMIDEVTIWLEARSIDISRIHRECFFNSSY
jgi:ferredoxin--NADP+ reductase